MKSRLNGTPLVFLEEEIPLGITEYPHTLEILLQEFRQIDLNTSEQGFVHALRHATNEEEQLVLDHVLENMVSQQLLEEESATVVLPHVALVYNVDWMQSPICSNPRMSREEAIRGGLWLRLFG